MRGFIIVLIMISFWGCKPYSKSDIYNDTAKVEKDELVHEKNSLEWWYFTGHLKEKNGERKFGVEYVFFHTNPFGAKDYTLMNFAITDPQTQKFYFDYEINQLKHKLKTKNPIEISTPNNGSTCKLTGFEGNYEILGSMKNHSAAINLSTTNTKKAILHENRGYKKYGDLAEAGYYSYTRLQTAGFIELNGEKIEVEGLLWYDRQWNCGDVYGGRVSWDWMAIQLNETGDDIMAYQITTPRVDENKIFGGTFLNNNIQLDLKKDDLEMIPIKFWKSTETNTTYPIAWNVKLPKQNIDLTIEALVDNQELSFRFGAYKMKYWEGMCNVTGTKNGIAVTGNAYLEMTNRKIANKIEDEIYLTKKP